MTIYIHQCGSDTFGQGETFKEAFADACSYLDDLHPKDIVHVSQCGGGGELVFGTEEEIEEFLGECITL